MKIIVCWNCLFVKNRKNSIARDFVKDFSLWGLSNFEATLAPSIERFFVRKGLDRVRPQ